MAGNQRRPIENSVTSEAPAHQTNTWLQSGKSLEILCLDGVSIFSAWKSDALSHLLVGDEMLAMSWKAWDRVAGASFSTHFDRPRYLPQLQPHITNDTAA
jgi:hypothetical protein